MVETNYIVIFYRMTPGPENVAPETETRRNPPEKEKPRAKGKMSKSTRTQS